MSRMIEDLIAQGFKLRSYNIGTQYVPCPRCSPTRKKKTDPCVSVTISDDNSALYHCHHCEWSGKAGTVRRTQENIGPKKYIKPEVKDSSSLPLKVTSFLEKRGITRKVWERNKLSYSTETNSLCFPFIYQGSMVNIKYRNLSEKKFSLVKGAQLIFYGLDDIKAHDTIIIVEGEFDKLALEVCGFTNVISVPNGAPSRIKEGNKIENTGQYEYLQHAEDIIRKVKKVIIAVDNDQTGKNLQYELARRIGAEKCWIVEFPNKDANDCLLEFGIDVVCDAIRDARAYPIHGLYTVMDFDKTLFAYFKDVMSTGAPTGWANIDMHYSIPPGRLTVVVGIPNSGKSEWIDALMWNLAKNDDWRFAVFSPENGKEAHVTKLIEKVIGKSTNPKSDNRMSDQEFIEGMAVIAQSFYFIVSEDTEELPTLDWILEKAKIAIYRHGIRGLLIDPYNEIEHKRAPGEQETEYISKLLTKLKKFAKIQGLHIWIVVHPSKMQSDKDGNTLMPSLYDATGSAHWANKTDFGIVVHRGNDVTNITEIHIKKVRFKHEGKRGMCNLIYHTESGTYRMPEKKPKYSLDENEDEIISY